MSSAEDLLARMKQTKAGWRARDLESLYAGFGFDHRNDGDHTVYWKAGSPHLKASVPRHPGELPKTYAKEAVKLVERLLQEQRPES